ncbi:hypothetical protein [Streptomyces lavendofoliae]|uniref:Uncharacterized protein n=1 Tax=Streptomyces lavendofoliae TaxID=67314 RepID=A0A918HSR9_9ACTN|nr:hypothetical protein [Streptomyces lavendofoliae]GGU20362.1 hypothetical protein GCM10010274_03560 [Streptomyces lavendofoliae]
MSSPARTNRVERAVAFCLRNFEVVFAAGIGLTVGILDIFGDKLIESDFASGATLVVLGALAVGSLSERTRRPHAIQEAMEGTRRAIEDLTMVRSLAGNEVREALREARQGTNLWYFKGGTGTYLRAVTLPQCVRAAKENRSQLNVKIEILNPADERACNAYAQFRRMFSGSRPNNADLWTADRTRKESYATVLAACWFRMQLSTLDISVHLSSTVPTLRFDLSDSGLIITQDDPARVNLQVRRGQPLYDYYLTELHQSREQATAVDLRDATLLSLSPTVDEVRALFDALALPLPRAFTDADVGEVIAKALHPEDPYGR